MFSKLIICKKVIKYQKALKTSNLYMFEKIVQLHNKKKIKIEKFSGSKDKNFVKYLLLYSDLWGGLD